MRPSAWNHICGVLVKGCRQVRVRELVSRGLRGRGRATRAPNSGETGPRSNDMALTDLLAPVPGI